MTATQNILRVGTAMQSIGLLGKNIGTAKKNLKGSKTATHDLTKTAMTNIIGIPLITTQSQLIGELS